MKITIQSLNEDVFQFLIERQGNEIINSTTATHHQLSIPKIKSRRQTISSDGRRNATEGKHNAVSSSTNVSTSIPIDRKLSSFFLVRNALLNVILLRLAKVTCSLHQSKTKEKFSRDKFDETLTNIISYRESAIAKKNMLQEPLTFIETNEYIEIRDLDNSKLWGILQGTNLFIHILVLKEILWKENRKPKESVDLSSCCVSEDARNNVINMNKLKLNVMNNVPLLCLTQWVPGMIMLPTKISKLFQPCRFEQYDPNNNNIISLYYYYLSTLDLQTFTEAVAVTLARSKCNEWKHLRDYCKTKSVDSIAGLREMHLICNNQPAELKLFIERFREHYEFIFRGNTSIASSSGEKVTTSTTPVTASTSGIKRKAAAIRERKHSIVERKHSRKLPPLKVATVTAADHQLYPNDEEYGIVAISSPDINGEHNFFSDEEYVEDNNYNI